MLSSSSTLADQLKGRVILPAHPDYDEARSVFYGNVDSRPSAIVKVANADDVARAIAHAREAGLELAVRSGGHSVAGHSTTEGGVVVDLTDMKKLEIDPERRIAWAETGLTAGEYTAAAGRHGLATGFGDTGSVGIGGITLGGGVGFLARKHGLAIDSLIAADIVTADRELLRVDAEMCALAGDRAAAVQPEDGAAPTRARGHEPGRPRVGPPFPGAPLPDAPRARQRRPPAAA